MGIFFIVLARYAPRARLPTTSADTSGFIFSNGFEGGNEGG
jgi:hypothetical protein